MDEREELAFAIVQNINAAATALAKLSDLSEDIDAADNYNEWCLWLRDWADRFFPPKEDWGGKNIIRFPHERRA